MSGAHMRDSTFAELTSLFFTTKQIIRSKLPEDGSKDPNRWLRCETLHYVAQAKNPTMQDVADYLRVTAPSATSLVSNLAKAGLIARKAGQRDKRVVRVSLTKKGAHMFDEYRKTSAATMRKVFSKLDSGEVERLTATLRRLRDIHQA